MSKQRTKAATEAATHKITQFLYEAHALELALVQTLTAHIAMTPAGEYRSGLETHRDETRDHAERIQRHLARRDSKRSVLQVGYGLAQGVIGQAVALGKAPIDMVRGTSGEELLLRNVRDECASEAAEVAMYLMIEQYATEVGDDQTARLAASIRGDEERMLERLYGQLPRLVADAVAADVDGSPQFALGRIGAIDGVRSAASTAARSVSRATGRAARSTQAKEGSSAKSSRPSVSTPKASTSLKRAPTKRAAQPTAPRAKAKAKASSKASPTAKPAAKRSATARRGRSKASG
ncbi:MAG: hypothetical protein JWN72_1250 [Thermoleophilia bacterium]|nr:hypothetical protein [Thermoleophilia bacterium]